MRGAEGPAFFSKKIHEKRAVTLRIDAPAGAIGRHPPPKGGEARKNPEETRSKNEIHHQAESETGGAIRPAAEKGVLQAAAPENIKPAKRSSGISPMWSKRPRRSERAAGWRN